MSEEIISALATAWGESGISVVRLSGEGSLALADKIFRSRHPLAWYPPRHMALGKLCAANGQEYDEVLAVHFMEGSSYTGEESVEIHCHGGILPAQMCIEELCSIGARIAMPGEFTRRAFVNGRIDLSQAEAVLGIIKARSDEALRASLRTLQGGFTEEIKKFLDELTLLAAQLEVNLDFPEEGEGLLPETEFIAKLKKLISDGESLFARCRSGLILREGIRVAIIGRPNVGKSSLLNILLREERAIVTPIPGTTRDRIEETFVHKGVPVRIIDTAGIRDTSDEIESIGVKRSINAMNEADLCIWVLDSAEILSDDDLLLGHKASALNHIIVLNKSDLHQKTTSDDLKKIFPASTILYISALKSDGIDKLRDMIVEYACGGTVSSDAYGVTNRQMECLKMALSSIREAELAIAGKIGDDIAVSCISDARSGLSSLLGTDATEDLLDVIFSTFCVGK